VTQCLAKEPDDRWQSAGDLKKALQWTAEGGSQVGIPLAISVHRKFRERAMWGAIAVLAIAFVVVGALYYSRPSPATKVGRFVISTPSGLKGFYCPRVSPDGSMIAFLSGDTANQAGIYLRPVNSLDAHLLVRIKATTIGTSRPFWSPDSKQLAYFENNQLKKVSVTGGLSQLVCEAPRGSDGSWGSTGVIIFDGQSNADSIRQVSASGGTPSAACRIDHARKEVGSAWPYFLPDGEHFLFLATKDSTVDHYTLKVGSIRSLEETVLTTVNSTVEYSNGYLIYLQKDLLVAQKFDSKKLQLTGEPVPLAANVGSDGQLALFSVSDEGTLIYERWLGGGLNTIVSVNRQGDSLVQIGPASEYSDFSLSPDNTRLAYTFLTDSKDGSDIWVRDIKRDVASRLTFGGGYNSWPIWNHDGTKVLFNSNNGSGRWCEMQHNANGTGSSEKVLGMDSLDIGVTDVSRDGSLMILESGSAGSIDIWTYNAVTKKAERFPSPSYDERRGVVSSDGRYLAYESMETGNPEIYIRELTPSGGKWQVSTAMGRGPRWRADGRELYYVIPKDFSFMAVPISYGKSLEIGTPVRLFSHRFQFSAANNNTTYAPTSDGKRFYFLTSDFQGSSSDFVVVQNWIEELKK
jgi:Tol biopolymer transport system component